MGSSRARTAGEWIASKPQSVMFRIQGLRVRGVCVPMTPPHRTAGGIVSESPWVLTDLFSDDGVVGHSLDFTYTKAALQPTVELIRNLGVFLHGVRRGISVRSEDVGGQVRHTPRILPCGGLVQFTPQLVKPNYARRPRQDYALPAPVTCPSEFAFPCTHPR